ncbi:nucleoside deaminase [Ilumatobacter sp.]|uniref:nucleoside deaminase n=1 Tax=Ilumatobacter sp. TaxID=1967498 RepID=UPI003C4EF2C2
MSDVGLADLAAPWGVVFDEAWASFRAGSFGIGAALVDPVDGSIVTVGRNRVAQHDPEPRTLSGNMMAHAEMNAFARIDRFNADGLHLYTTLEPCLMCAATAMQMRVAHVHVAAADEFYAGMDDLWSHHPVTAARRPLTTGPLGGRLARFARLLPMVYTLHHFPGRSAEQRARREHPDLAIVADRLNTDPEFAGTVRAGSVIDAIDLLLGPTPPIS